jgi:hypothetical protein
VHVLSSTQKEEARREEMRQRIDQIKSLCTKGLAFSTFQELAAKETIASRVNTTSHAYVQGVLSNGMLRISIENEPSVRLVELDDVSFPLATSTNTEERNAAKASHELLEHVLLNKQVIVNFVRYLPTVDRLVVKIYLPLEP